METISAREADVLRTCAALFDIAANGCRHPNDWEALMTREGDALYPVWVCRQMLAALVGAASNAGIRDGKIRKAERILEAPIPDDDPGDISAYVEAAHQTAHMVIAINVAYRGWDETRRRTRAIVNNLATGNFGDGVKVE